MAKNKHKKVWLESISERTEVEHWGMSSAEGGSVSDLPSDVPQGSDCMDYTAMEYYTFDGMNWNKA